MPLFIPVSASYYPISLIPLYNKTTWKFVCTSCLHFLYHYLFNPNELYSSFIPHLSIDNALFKFISNITVPDLIISMLSSSCSIHELCLTQLIPHCFGDSWPPGLRSPLILLLSLLVSAPHSLLHVFLCSCPPDFLESWGSVFSSHFCPTRSKWDPMQAHMRFQQLLKG